MEAKLYKKTKHTRRTPLAWIVGLAFCCAFASCSRGDGKHGVVSGDVTLDTQPLQAGTIRFAPTDAHSAPAETTIANGKYSVTVPVGESRVTISAPKVTGKRKMYNTPESPMVDTVVELLPAQYNAQSALSLKVAPTSQQQNYDLKSGK